MVYNRKELIMIIANQSRLSTWFFIVICFFTMPLFDEIYAASGDSLSIQAGKQFWKFIDTGMNQQLVENIERNYDMPFAGRSILSWQGQGIADQTVVYSLGENNQDLSNFSTIIVWVKIENEGQKVEGRDQLFTDGGGDGDGNIHISLWDKNQKDASAFIQKQILHFSKWNRISIYLKDFQGVDQIDLKNIGQIGVGFNVIDTAGANVTLTFSFSELQLVKDSSAVLVKSKVYPSQFLPSQRLYLLSDFPNYLQLAFAAPKELVTQIEGDIDVQIEIPKDLCLRAVSGYLIGWDIIEPEKPVQYFNFPQMQDWRDRNVSIKHQDIIRDGQKYIRHTVPLDKLSVIKKLREKLEGSPTSGLDIYLSANKDAHNKGQIFWKSDRLGLDWKCVDYEILPKLPRGPAPKRLTITAWCGLELYPEILWPEMVDMYKTAGFTAYTSSGWLSPRIKRLFEILSQNEITTYQSGQPAVYASMFATEPNDKSLWAFAEDDQINPFGIACLTYCAEKGKKFIEASEPFYKKAAEYYPVSGLINDFEMGGTTKICYNCPRCRKAFAAYLSVDPNIITPQAIRQKYNQQFREWHLKQNAQIAQNWVEMARHTRNNMTVILCSGHIPSDINFVDRYIDETGTDPRLWDDVVDQHWPMMYFNGLSLCLDIQKTTEFLKKPVVPLLGSQWDVGLDKFTSEQTELNVLACLLGRTNGYGFYVGFVPWDGMYWYKITRLSHLAATIEDVILDGNNVTDSLKIENCPNDIVVRAYKLDKRIVIGAINYSKNGNSPVIELNSLFHKSRDLEILYYKGERNESNIVLTGTKLKLNLNSEDAVFVQLFEND